MQAHRGGSWDVPNIDSETGKSKWLAKGDPEEMPHISDLNYHKGTTLSLSPPVCLSTCILFPPNKHFTCFTTFHLCGNSFLQSRRARTLSLATGLVARIQHSHCHGPTSISGWEPKPCFKSLQAKATWDHLHLHVDHLDFFFHEMPSNLLCLAVFLFLIDLKLSLDQFIVILWIMYTLILFIYPGDLHSLFRDNVLIWTWWKFHQNLVSKVTEGSYFIGVKYKLWKVH